MAEHQMVEQVVLMPENGPSAFVAARGHGGFHPRNFGRGAASPTREGFPNQRGGSSRGTFFQLSVLPILGSLQHRLLEELFARYLLTAMASSPTTISRQSNGTWLLDTGANAHITPKLQNIINPKEYTSNEQVGGVGITGLHISHFGSSTVNTDSCKFSLNDILHCPSTSTNLISVHRFTSDNHCYILIFPDCFVGKDLKTRKMLFQERCENELYPFNLGGGLSNKSFSAFVGTQVSAKKWHYPLGHPASSVVRFLISNKQVPLSGTSDVSFC